MYEILVIHQCYHVTVLTAKPSEKVLVLRKLFLLKFINFENSLLSFNCYGFTYNQHVGSRHSQHAFSNIAIVMAVRKSHRQWNTGQPLFQKKKVEKSHLSQTSSYFKHDNRQNFFFRVINDLGTGARS